MQWLPYAIAIGAQLPLLMFYFIGLWGRGPHYHFFPLAMLAVAGIAWLRWPRDERMPFHRSLWSDFLLLLGLGSGILAAVFLEPWFAAASSMLLLASLLARTVDPETGRGQWVVALPLFVALTIPFNGDMMLITFLQRISALFTSRVLDLIGMGHHMPGTVIQIPGKEPYGIEQACSGVMSFFTLLFVAVVFIVWNRRPWFRATLLLISAVFWAIFMNTVRIFMIPFADNMMGLNLADGFAHNMLGWIVLVIGILLLLSTDQFLMFLFGPVETSTGRTGPFGNFITEVWNGLVAGRAETQEEKEKRKRRAKRRKPVTGFGRTLAWTAAGILGLCGVWQLVDSARSFSAGKHRVTVFQSAVVEPMADGDLRNIGDWTKVGYEPEDRKRGSDQGLRSDTWYYKSPAIPRAVASFDQTFPGWHELTTCYRSQGWEVEERGRIRRNPDSEGKKWPYIEVRLRKETGERGFLLFSFFDAFGEPFDAPAEWGTINSFFIRAQSRMSHRVRARLFQSEAYQCQVFVPSYRDLTDVEKDEITDHFLLIRDELRVKFLEKRGLEGTTPEAPQNDEEGSAAITSGAILEPESSP